MNMFSWKSIYEYFYLVDDGAYMRISKVYMNAFIYCAEDAAPIEYRHDETLFIEVYMNIKGRYVFIYLPCWRRHGYGIEEQ